MNYNYHTHTLRCAHATGTPEEYIKRAIENGIEYMGFSDHAPFIYPDGYEEKYRVPATEASQYVRELSALREKYHGKIDIKIGFEMEYYPTHFEEMLARAIDAGGEYLILGQHFLKEDSRIGVHTVEANDDAAQLDEYVETVIKAIESGYFTYVAHPDIFNFTGDAQLYRRQMRKICVASKENNIPLEINFLGIRDGRNYPSEAFWKVAGEERCPVTFGFDAHSTNAAYDGESLIKAKKMVEKYNLNYIGKPDVILINE